MKSISDEKKIKVLKKLVHSKFVTSTVEEAGYALNIVVNSDGTISPTPFSMPKSGLWYFDGQVYYQKEAL